MLFTLYRRLWTHLLMQNCCVSPRKYRHHLRFGKVALPANCWWLFALFLWGLALCLRVSCSHQQKPSRRCLPSRTSTFVWSSLSSHRCLLCCTLSWGKGGVWKRFQHCCEQEAVQSEGSRLGLRKQTLLKGKLSKGWEPQRGKSSETPSLPKSERSNPPSRQ